MSRIYNSLKEAVQETFQRGNSHPLNIAQPKDKHAAGLTDEIEELETIVADRIGRLKAVVKEEADVFEDEKSHAKQIISGLSDNITSLETELHKAHESLHRNGSSRVERDLSWKSQISQEEKPESLADQDENDLALSQLEAAITEAVSRATIAEQVGERSKTKINLLETQLGETESAMRTKEASAKQLVERFHEKIQQLEWQARKNEELLADRDRQVKDFRFKLRVLKNWIGEMSPFFRQAEEALLAVDTDGGDERRMQEHQPATAIAHGQKITSNSTETAHEIVSERFFDRMTIALGHLLGPRAAAIIRGHVAALGESVELFPKSRVPELVEIVSREITDENLKIGFREILADF
jgi:hypothetical protein